MPTVTYRAHRKTADGSYETVHLESESGVIMRPNGATVEQTLTKCIVTSDPLDELPAFQLDADTLGGSTKEEIIAEAVGGVSLDASNLTGVVAIEHGGTGGTTAEAARTNLEVAKPVRAEVTFPSSGWTVSNGAYVQTVTCSVAAATMKYANIGPKYSTTAATRKNEQTAYSYIAYVDTNNGSLTATCWDSTNKPGVNLTLIFEGGV